MRRDESISFACRSPLSGLWRAVRISDNVLHPPSDGWGENKYIVVTAKADLSDGSVSETGKEAEDKWRDREGARGERNFYEKQKKLQ